MNLDVMSLTAHKVYGPKGIGALYVRPRNPRVRLAAQLHGGGQEKRVRAGTLYTPQIVGFAKAVKLGLEEIESEGKRQSQLRNHLWHRLSQLDGIHLNGHSHSTVTG